ncbi:uncharacterized protein N7458_010313 [Penicillium daleae]|uniref:Uncharacterized protein n=1 Tax=Penicillium daleae TaxID=63821 RepID=A0AAD6FZ74_9EURO|nr:uncharacterized protein N7458_010313 [Penicillium daleae]KAJ5439315.1 hypothetical protein N7458_010313 [Penicillium daleae]
MNSATARGVTTSSGMGVAAGGASQRHRYKGSGAFHWSRQNENTALAHGLPRFPGSGKIRASAKKLETKWVGCSTPG